MINAHDLHNKPLKEGLLLSHFIDEETEAKKEKKPTHVHADTVTDSLESKPLCFVAF